MHRASRLLRESPPPTNANGRSSAGAVLNHAVLAPEVTVRPYTVVDESTVAAGAILGPFSRLRPGSEIGEGAHVGNFVETKKSRLGKGAKANHLAYVGDATVGAGAIMVRSGMMTSFMLTCPSA